MLIDEQRRRSKRLEDGSQAKDEKDNENQTKNKKVKQVQRKKNVGEDLSSSSPPLAPVIFENRNNFVQLTDPMAKAIGNPLILKRILENLISSDILKNRLVCSQWNDIATTVLLQKRQDDLKISFTFDHRARTFYVEYDIDGEKEEMKSIDDLNNCLKNSKWKFPVCKYIFNGGNLGSRGVQDFFNKHGASIKSLKLYLHSGDRQYTKLSTLRKLLLKQVINLEYLNIKTFYDISRHNTSNEARLFPPPPPLIISDPSISSVISTTTPPLKKRNNPKKNNDPNPSNKLLKLKTLKLSLIDPQDSKWIEDIVYSAPNLQNIEFKDNPKLSYLDHFIKMKKLHLIKEFNCLPDQTEMNLFEKFSRLSSLSLKGYVMSLKYSCRNPEVWPRFIQIMQKILESNCKTIQELKVVEPVLLSAVKMPVMEKVRDLHLSFRLFVQHENRPIFPEDFKFTEIFPKLENVYMEIEELWPEMFRDTDAFPHVKKLIMYECSECPLLAMNKFPTVFPNITVLTMTDIQDFPSFGAALWKMTNLEYLELEIYTETSSPNLFPDLDATFTGFKPSTVRRLKKSHTKEVKDLTKLRVKPSILDLKNLKRLDIMFYDADDFHVYPNTKYELLTKVTGLYAFRKMPQVRINISMRLNDMPLFEDCSMSMSNYGAKLETCLNPIAPYANVLKAKYHDVSFASLLKF